VAWRFPGLHAAVGEVYMREFDRTLEGIVPTKAVRAPRRARPDPPPFSLSLYVCT
jgi:hypothetical protein